jgi:hypothetical protein
MSASRSTSTWSRLNSAVKNYQLFASIKGLSYAMPIPTPALRGYVNWALKDKKLSPATVRVYLSDLKNFQKLEDLPTSNFEDFFVSSMIKGAESLSLYDSLAKRVRLAMSYPLLKIIGHEIANSNWTTHSKKVFWTACCVAFFGSFRMGELLSQEETKYNTEALTWDCVKFVSDDSAVIQIKFPKTSKSGSSQFVDIFRTSDSSTCPLTCLKVYTILL